MGQYFKCIMTKGKKQKNYTYCSWDYGNGAKLTEHSWLVNPMVLAVTTKLINNPMRVAWMGDYSSINDYVMPQYDNRGELINEKEAYKNIPYSQDDESIENLGWNNLKASFKDGSLNPKMTIKEWVKTLGGGFFNDTEDYMKYYKAVHDNKVPTEKFMVKLGQVFDEYNNYWRDNYGDEGPKVKRDLKEMEEYIDGYYTILANGLKRLYLWNYTKKEYVSLGCYYALAGVKKDNSLHPLPILTACGNGQGIGDYYGKNKAYVGRWAFDKIGIYESMPKSNEWKDITKNCIFIDEYENEDEEK